MFRSVSKFLVVAALAVCAAACTTVAPDATGVAAIQNACAVDAGLRPTVDVLLAFATPQEKATVVGARAVIDPVCANPSGTFEANTVAAVTGASAQIVGLLTTLQERKAHPPSPAPAASAVKVVMSRTPGLVSV